MNTMDAIYVIDVLNHTLSARKMLAAILCIHSSLPILISRTVSSQKHASSRLDRLAVDVGEVRTCDC